MGVFVFVQIEEHLLTVVPCLQLEFNWVCLFCDFFFHMPASCVVLSMSTSLLLHNGIHYLKFNLFFKF